MAALVAVVLTIMISVGAFRYVTKRHVRAQAHDVVLRKPGVWAFLVFGAASLLTFFWGVFIPAIGTIKIPLGGYTIPLWQLGGIGSAIWLVIYLAGWRDVS